MNEEELKKQSLKSLSLAALGVVYGDIGTSPLYAVKESLIGMQASQPVILGILSLIFWSLIIVISIKYLAVLFQADNNGEGGILAVLSLIRRISGEKHKLFYVFGIFGAGLMLGDGMLTPAISVISAVEGVNVIFPTFSSLIIPITCVILLGLFSVQSFGTARIGFIFGPIVLIWFIVLGFLGIHAIISNPVVLKAVNPIYAIYFFKDFGWHAYALLGGVFLVMTGGEALYADLGHFGKTPIRVSWFFVALPSLLLNYFGQGANILLNPDAIENPFYLLAPAWGFVPLIFLSTLVTIIASQAVISATFSLVRQAILLGFYPHLNIIQTSSKSQGQVYIPQMNAILAIGTFIIIFIFKNSNAMTHAYGIAVNLEMLLVNIFIVYLAIKYWHWNKILIWVMFFVFLGIDLVFLGANSQKIVTGGWMPIVFALFCAFVMYTWKKGRYYIYRTYHLEQGRLSRIIKQLNYKSLHTFPEITAIFITDIYDQSGGSFLHFLKLNRALPGKILILNYLVEDIPYVNAYDRFEVKKLKDNICVLTLHYGFMDIVSIPQALYVANDRNILPFNIDVHNATYLLEIPNVVASRRKKSLAFFWQEKFFAFLVRNYSANLNIEFYQLPYNRTIAIGTYYII